jgi:hypothetical protein
MAPESGQHDQWVDIAAAWSRAERGPIVFALDSQGRISQRSPSGWRIIPGSKVGAASAIAACRHGEDALALIAVASRRVYFRNRSRGLRASRGWQETGTMADRVVDVACWSLAAGSVEIFALDTGGMIWSSSSRPGLSGWTEWRLVNRPADDVCAIATSSSPAALLTGKPERNGALLAVTLDGTIYRGRHEAGKARGPHWPAWSPLPPLTAHR